MARPRTPIGHVGKITTTKIGPGNYVAKTRIRASDGQTYQLQRAGRSASAAENALKVAAAETRREAGAEITPDTRVSDLAQRFLANRRPRVEPGTLTAYESVIRNHVTPDVGALAISEASIPRLQRFLDGVAADHGSGAAKMCRKVLSGMFGLAVRSGATDRNPVRELEGVSSTGGGGAKPITGSELRRFLTLAISDEWAISHDLPGLLVFMAGVGCRIGEACAVRWEDVDLETGTVTISGTITRIKGQGLVRKPKTKTRAGARTLALPAPIVGMLMERRVAQTTTANGVVFPSPTGKLRDPSNTEHDLAKLRDRLGYPDVQFHSFRKGVATALKDAGVDPRDRADYLGHENVTLTLDVYTARGGGSTRVADVLSEVVNLG